MKVLHINQHLKWAGGVETYLLSLVPELTIRGHEQAVVYAEGRADLVSESYSLPELSSGNRAAEHKAEKAMHRILDEAEPDRIHLHQVYNIGAVRACLQRLPVLVHGHDYRYLCPASTFYYKRTREVCSLTSGLACFTTTLRKHCMTPRPRYALDYYRRVKWFEREAGRFAGVIAPSESARQRFLAAGFEAEQVKTLPYFCPLEPVAEPRELPSKPTVLFIGRIRPTKGIDTFIQAFARMPENAQAVIVGDFTDETRNRVMEQATKLGCSERIELQGWIDRESIRQVYASASVFVFPSIWPETLGIVGIEALACGVPVVASDIGGVREWLIPGETGYLALPKSVTELAQGMEKLLFDSQRNLAFGRNGIELVKNKFSIDHHINELVNLYEGCDSPIALPKAANR